MLAVKNEKLAVDKAAEAERNLSAKIEEENRKERLNFDRLLENGDVFLKSDDHNIAIRYFQKADSLLQRFPYDSLLQTKKHSLLEKNFMARYKILK